MNISELHRGKKTSNDMWIEGYLVRSKNSAFITIDSLYKEYRGDWNLYEIEEETLSKCSGMHDKNHTPIYAGDICSDGENKFIVAYNGTSFIFIDLLTNMGMLFTKDLAESVEIIGNNVDNPEMVSDFCKNLLMPTNEDESIQIGDYVRITNRYEYSFTSYETWVEKNAPEYLERFKQTGGDYINPLDWRNDKYASYVGIPYKVVAIAPHKNSDYGTLYLVIDHNEKNVFLLSEKGLYKV